MKKIELKRCPFCGGKADFVLGHDYREKYGIKEEWVICNSCGNQTKLCYSPEEAANLWNRREGKICALIAKEGESMDNIINFNTAVNVTDEDIDDIMATALEGGINYWCDKAEVIGERLGKEGWASEQISRGGILWLQDAETGEYYELDKEKFLTGLKKYLESPYYNGQIVDRDYYDGMKLDCGMIDAVDSDLIIQYALFGEIVFG